MTKPPLDNLGQRQHDLNARVNDAAANNVNFNEIEENAETTPVDKFFKIDLAAKCKNIDYIIEVLEAGDTLYAHRALKKCQWLYDDEYSHIINPEYLHNKIFPLTSMRVKRLLLKTVAMRVRTEERAAAFYNYCMKTNMTDVAFKCLLFTSEEFKLDLMRNHNEHPFNKIVDKKHSYIKFIIGKSFRLLKAYMKMLNNYQDWTILKFRYLYPVNNIQYLQLLEKYVSESYFKFDLKLCDDIMKNHKNRVLSEPLFYLKTLDSDIILRNSTEDDAKIYAAALSPSCAKEFWNSDHHQYLNLIPDNEQYKFIKNLFNDKYPGEEFETSPEFYHQEYHKYMTLEEREALALYHIKSDKQILGVGNDYIWYKFINFEDAFKEVKQLIIVTQDGDKRNEMLKILVESARNGHELTKLFDYYERRHVNELRSKKESFLDKVIDHHNVFEFDVLCWDHLFTLLQSLELFNTLDYRDCNIKYKTLTLIYYILNLNKIRDELEKFLLNDFYPYSLRLHLDKLKDQERLFLYSYLHEFFTKKISENKNKPHNGKSLERARIYFEIVLNLMHIFSDDEVTPIPQKQRKTRCVNTELSDRQLLRELKKNKTLAIGRLLELENRINQNEPVKISNFLKKIRIYFQTDISASFLDMFKRQIPKALNNQLEQQTVGACMHGIFELGDENTKVNLMDKYAPENTKIEYYNLDTPELRILKAICKYAPMSLPPVPLPSMLKYLQGDYVQHCLHVFSIYIAVLPRPACIKFVETLLATPVSIQKHAIRLAFHCFDSSHLKNMSKSIWETTKNVSLRSIIYKALFNRIVNKDESDLYDELISFTLDLNDDDEDAIFDIVVMNTLAHDIHGRYKEATWKAIGKFKDKEPNIQRKTKVIHAIQGYSHLIEKYFFGSIITEHLFSMFVENKLELYYSEEGIAGLYKAKWYLTADYIFSQTVDFARDGRDHQKYLSLAQTIVKHCVEKWNKTYSNKFIYQQLVWDFIRDLNINSLHYYNNSAFLIPIYEAILEVVKENLPLHENYMLRWQLQVTICNRQVTKKYWEIIKEDNISEVLRQSTREMGKVLGKLISEFIENKEYFMSFTENVKEIIHTSIKELLDNFVNHLGKEKEEYINGALISLILGLVESELAETYLIAVKLLPTQGPECVSDEYQYITNRINNITNPEVRHAVCRKIHLGL